MRPQTSLALIVIGAHRVSLVSPISTSTAPFISSISPSIHASMSKAKFEKAVSIVQSLPKDGPIKPTQDEQLIVRVSLSPDSPDPTRLHVLYL